MGRKGGVGVDPLDLTRIEVRLAGAPMGLTASHRIARHSHPKAKPEAPTAPSRPSGIDYAKPIESDDFVVAYKDKVLIRRLAGGHCHSPVIRGG
ncbi:hypothetical protein MAHJHV55_17740 [Mycobacterium avium subsp. hominissuis]